MYLTIVNIMKGCVSSWYTDIYKFKESKQEKECVVWL